MAPTSFYSRATSSYTYTPSTVYCEASPLRRPTFANPSSSPDPATLTLAPTRYKSAPTSRPTAANPLARSVTRGPPTPIKRKPVPLTPSALTAHKRLTSTVPSPVIDLDAVDSWIQIVAVTDQVVEVEVKREDTLPTNGLEAWEEEGVMRARRALGLEAEETVEVEMVLVLDGF